MKALQAFFVIFGGFSEPTYDACCVRYSEGSLSINFLSLSINFLSMLAQNRATLPDLV